MRFISNRALRCVLFSFALTLVSRVCSAAEPSGKVSLHWHASEAEACTRPEVLMAEVESQLGKRIFGPEPTDISIEVSVERTTKPFGFHADLHVQNAAGRVWGNREILSEGADCRKLDAPLLLVLGIMVDSDLLRPPAEVLPVPEEPRQADASSDSAIEQQPREQVALPVPSGPTRPWQPGIDATGEFASGLLPNLAFGGDLGVSLVSPWPLGVRLHAGLFAAQSVPLAAGKVAFNLANLGLALCPELERSDSLRIETCIGIDWGLLRARSEGLDFARTVTRRTVQAPLTFRSEFPLGARWYVSAWLAAIFAVSRPTFAYTAERGSREAIPASSPLAGALGAGVGYWFP